MELGDPGPLGDHVQPWRIFHGTVCMTAGGSTRIFLQFSDLFQSSLGAPFRGKQVVQEW